MASLYWSSLLDPGQFSVRPITLSVFNVRQLNIMTNLPQRHIELMTRLMNLASLCFKRTEKSNEMQKISQNNKSKSNKLTYDVKSKTTIQLPSIKCLNQTFQYDFFVILLCACVVSLQTTDGNDRV